MCLLSTHYISVFCLFFVGENFVFVKNYKALWKSMPFICP